MWKLQPQGRFLSPVLYRHGEVGRDRRGADGDYHRVIAGGEVLRHLEVQLEEAGHLAGRAAFVDDLGGLAADGGADGQRGRRRAASFRGAALRLRAALSE
jgi:hypothetical protein